MMIWQSVEEVGKTHGAILQLLIVFVRWVTLASQIWQ